jgi:predicted nucleic acid-binding protein
MIARKTGLPLLMDEASGRSLAETFGLKVNGTVYVIFKGLEEGCLKREETTETVLRLVEKGFRIEPGLLSRILRAIETGRG